MGLYLKKLYMTNIINKIIILNLGLEPTPSANVYTGIVKSMKNSYELCFGYILQRTNSLG